MTWTFPLIAELISLHGLAVMTGLLIYVLGSHVLKQRRHPAAAVGWVLVMVLLPYVGLPLYLLFGRRKLVHSANHPPLAADIADVKAEGAWARQLAAAMGQPAAAGYENLRIHADGAQALEALWEVIESARRELILSTFIIGNDDFGDALAACLESKARAGVRVRFMLDGVGRWMGGFRNLGPLEAAGVDVALFVPLLHSPLRARTNLRNHRKILVADGMRLWSGGRNLAAEYFTGSPSQPPWQDLTFDLQGPLARQAAELFERDWAFATRLARPNTEHVLPAPAAQLGQVIASGPDQADDTVHALLVAGCFNARKRIVAASPYFVPDEVLVMALTQAVWRGVAVDIILPRRSNHLMADHARHRALRDLASAGARIWLVPYMNHAKAVVIDDTLALAGSVNLDSRSLFLNYEMMVAFYAREDIERFANWLEAHRAKASLYQPTAPGLVREFSEGLVLWLGFQL